jgi:hypothetical protein
LREEYYTGFRQDKYAFDFRSLQAVRKGRLITGGDIMAKDRSGTKEDKTKSSDVAVKDQKDQKKNMPCKNSVPT